MASRTSSSGISATTRLRLGDDELFRLADLYRALRPAFVLTHSRQDPYNFDHPATCEFTQHARIIAQAHGHKPGEGVLGAPPVFLFEPHQPEQCDWKPDVLLDITLGLGQEARGDRVHDRPGAPLGILHARRRAARRAGGAELRQEDRLRRSL